MLTVLNNISDAFVTVNGPPAHKKILRAYKMAKP